MNINFNLFDKGREVTSIRVIVRHRGKVYRRAVGMTCRTADWSDKKQKTGNAKTDKALTKIRLALETHLSDYSTPAEINHALDKVLANEDITPLPKRNRPTFWEYFESWLSHESKVKRERLLIYNNIRRLMGTTDDWEDIDTAYYTRLIGKMRELGWAINYQGANIKYLKAVMHEGYQLHYHTNDAWKSFHKMSESVDKIYLTTDEMERIWNYAGNEPLLCKSRDLAWVGYLTCARFSDFSRISIDNIGTDGKVRFSQEKTSRQVVLPCSARLRQILERNGGKAPRLCQQLFNTNIKKLCALVGIDDMIEYSVSEGALHHNVRKPKYELVTSHTFRRSAATNLYLQGVPLRSIMALTGHTSVAMLEKYLKVTNEENADRLSGLDFFK